MIAFRVIYVRYKARGIRRYEIKTGIELFKLSSWLSGIYGGMRFPSSVFVSNDVIGLSFPASQIAVFSFKRGQCNGKH